MEAIPKSEMSRELVIPEFRKFCRLNGLNFHFPDERSGEKFDYRLSEAEHPLLITAMDLFNALKPEHTIYKGQVVGFKFTCWDGDTNCTAQPVAEFLAQVAQDRKRLERLEKWLEVVYDVIAFGVGLICVVALYSWFPRANGWLGLVVLVTILICVGASWRWFLNTRPKKLQEQARAEWNRKLVDLRNTLASVQGRVEPEQTDLAEAAAWSLAEALSEHIVARLPANEPPDTELIRYLLNDLNSLLAGAGPGANLQPRHLRQAQTLLLPHLRSALEIPAQVLAKELPNRLRAWLAEEPKPKDPERPAWAEKGRWLLDQARTSSD